MKRLLIVSEPGKDGVFACVRDWIGFLHNRHPEVAVDFAFSSRRGSAELTELVDRVKLAGGSVLDMKTGNAPELADMLALIGIRKLLRYGAQLVHAHSSKAGALARLACRLPGSPPVLYNPHAYYGMAKAKTKKETIYNKIEQILGRWGHTLNCSQDELDFAEHDLKIPGKRLHLIHNGIDLKRFTPAPVAERAEFRKRLGLPPNGKLLITIGRASYQKNYEPFYCELNQFLPEMNGDVVFAHAGEGSEELRNTLSAEARKLTFAFRHLNDVSLLLRAADGFVLTSRYEGLSLSMLYGLACGLSLILTDAPGFRELRPMGFDDVLWLPNPDAPGFGDAIRSTLKNWVAAPDPDLEKRSRLVALYFDSEVQFEKTFALCQGIAERNLISRA